jgi:hypothetical protein
MAHETFEVRNSGFLQVVATDLTAFSSHINNTPFVPGDRVAAVMFNSWTFAETLHPGYWFVAQDGDIGEPPMRRHSRDVISNNAALPISHFNAYLTHAKSLLTGDFTPPQSVPKFGDRERDVNHVNLHGHVQTSNGVILAAGLNPASTVDQQFVKKYHGLTVTALSGGKVTGMVADSNSYWSNVTVGHTNIRLEAIKSTLDQWTGITLPIWNQDGRTRINFLNWNFSEDGLFRDLLYSSELEMNASGLLRVRIETNALIYRIPPAPVTKTVPVVGSKKSLPVAYYRCLFTRSAQWRATQDSDAPFVQHPTVTSVTNKDWGLGSRVLNFYRGPNTKEASFQAVLDEGYGSTTHPYTDRYLNQWKEYTSSIYRDTIGLFHLSASDAMSNLTGLTGEVVESFLELGGLGHSLDFLKAVPLLHNHLRRRDYGMSLKVMLDLLADAHLVFKYGLAATLRDAYAFSEEIGPTIERIRHMPHEFVVRGKHTFVLPETEPMSGTVVARTKIPFTISGSTVMIALMGARALGLMSPLATSWGLLRYSFILDWFTNLQDRFEAIDNSAFSLLLNIPYTVNSLEFSHDIPSYLLDNKQVYPAPVATIVDFQRQVLPTYPAPAPSRFNFLPATPSNNWKTGAALAWANFT